MQFGFGETKRRLRGVLVAGFDRALDVFDEGAHAAQPGTVGRGAFFGLPKTFFGGFVMRHMPSEANGSAAYIGVTGRPSTGCRPIRREIGGFAQRFLKAGLRL